MKPTNAGNAPDESQALAPIPALPQERGPTLKEPDTDTERLKVFQHALRVLFATLGAGFYSTGQAHEMIHNMRMCGVPEDVLLDCATHFTMNRNPFMHDFMG